jgi:acyl carrier protein
MVELKEKIKTIIEKSVLVTNSQLPKIQRITSNASQVILDGNSSLDSLGLVTLIANIEDALMSEGFDCSLLDELLNEHEEHPFQTIETMVDWIYKQVS